jgi:membrane associated rhomboid family serine protease
MNNVTPAMTVPIETAARIRARSRRQAMDWSLALVSQGVETTLDSDPEMGWGLIVSPPDYERAVGVIEQYRAENRGWPWRHRISRVLFDWGSLGWVILLGLFFWLENRSANFRAAGVMDAAAVSGGQWWRLFTATFLHADFSHLAANAGIGAILLGLTMGCYGTGVGLLAAYVGGVGGNLATWLIYRDHHSLGASGMVMACVGLLAAQSISIPRKNPAAMKYAVSGILGGVLLFVMLGLNPDSDVLAHLGGFVTGLGIGAMLTLARPLVQNLTAQVFSGVTFCALALLPWWKAIGASG